MSSSFHTHCDYCDGRGKLEEYVEAAIAKGFKRIGFSSHAPIYFETVWNMKEERAKSYFAEIDSLKEKYSDKIEIYKGLEIDYLVEEGQKPFDKYTLDYKIGSIHFISDLALNKHYSVDGNENDFKETVRERFNGSVQAYVTEYYRLMEKMIKSCDMDIVGHLDVIKKNNKDNRFFNEEEDWYVEAVGKVLDIIAKRGVILEVNTGGVARGYIKDTYPGIQVLKGAMERGIPVMLNSDAHAPKNLDCFYKEAIEILHNAGYFEQKVLISGEWKMVKL